MTTRAQMLESVAAAKRRMETLPASRSVIQVHAVLEEFEAAWDGRDPSDAEVKALLGKLSNALEGML